MARFFDALSCWIFHSGWYCGPVGTKRCAQCDRYIGDID